MHAQEIGSIVVPLESDFGYILSRGTIRDLREQQVWSDTRIPYTYLADGSAGLWNCGWFA